MNNKKVTKGAGGGPLKFLGSKYIVVLTDIIAIFLTAGLFLIQFFSTNV